MSKIWKQPLALPGFLAGDVPIRIEHQGILHVGLDPNGVPCVWFWAPEDDPTASEVLLIGTGVGIRNALVDEYIGSFNYRQFVLHAFRRDVTA